MNRRQNMNHNLNHKRNSIPRHNGRAMECPLWIFGDFWPGFNITALYQAIIIAMKLNIWHIYEYIWIYEYINTLRPRQNGRRFADDIFKCIFLNENVWISNKISLKFVPKGLINNIPALVQIMAWRRSGDKPLSEPMMVSLLTHICVTRPQ